MIVDKIDALMRGQYQPRQDDVARAHAFLDARFEGAKGGTLDRLILPRIPRNYWSGSTGYNCARRLWYIRNEVPGEGMLPRSIRKTEIGNRYEDVTVALAIAAGVPTVWPDETGKQFDGVAVVDGVSLPVHPDMVIQTDDYGTIPVEIKAHEGYSFERFTKEGPSKVWGYWEQDHLEMVAVGAKRCLHLAANVETGDYAERHVTWEESALDLVKASIRAARAESLPPAPAWVETKEIAGTEELVSKRCTYCGWREKCWPEHKLTVMAKGPVFRRPLNTANKE